MLWIVFLSKIYWTKVLPPPKDRSQNQEEISGTTHNSTHHKPRGGKNKQARRKFVWMKISNWKFERNLNTHVPLWVQQHMVDRHYSLNLKPRSARILYVYAHANLAQKYSVGLQEIFVSRECSQEENYFFLPGTNFTFSIWWCKEAIK